MQNLARYISFTATTGAKVWMGALNMQNKIFTTSHEASSYLEYVDGTPFAQLSGCFNLGTIIGIQNTVQKCHLR